MSHGPEHHIEHAEHAAHAAHDPFDKRVTLSIAITAAVLAFVTLLSHRAHNATLHLQLEANDKFSQASNEWNYFQSKKNRLYLYETADAGTDMLLGMPLPEAVKKSDDFKTWQDRAKQKKSDHWKKNAARYRAETDEIEAKAKHLTEEAKDLRKESGVMHGMGNRYDMAELAVEIGLVLCSLAVLTKQRGFWYGGLVCSLVGFVLALIGVYLQYFPVVHP
jgi:hypothetical protein